MTTTFSITRTEDSASYGFSIVPDSALGADITVRWEIVPIGELPVALTAPLTGTQAFTSGATAGIAISPTITPTNTHGFPRDFEIRLYKVVGVADDADNRPQNDEADELLLTEAVRLGGNSALLGDGGSDTNISGAQDKNIVGLGATDNLVANGAVNGDTYIVTRFQYGNVTIEDTGALVTNLIKFDYGVEITDYSEDALRLTKTFVRYTSITLTLSTGAEVKVQSPQGLFTYQLGDGAIMNLAEFRQEIGIIDQPHAINPDTGPTTTIVPDDFGYEVTSFTGFNSLTDLSSPREEVNATNNLSGLANEDAISAASDSILTLNGATNGDTYIITRFQYGNVTIEDTGALVTNLIKFDYDVEITNYSEDALRLTKTFVRYTSITLTLSTGAEITIQSPEGLFTYQLGDGEIMNLAEFRDVLGIVDQPDAMNPNGPTTTIVPDDFGYKVPLPPIDGNHLPVFGQGAYFASIDLGDMAGDAVIMLTATDADVVAGEQTLSYHITAGNSGGLFRIAESTGAITLARAPDAILDAQGYTLTIEVRDSNDPAGVDTATLTIAGFNNVTEDADVQYAYPEERGVAHSITTSQQAEVALLTTADDADSDAASVTEITQDRVDENGNTVTETIAYRATGTYGVFEYYLFGKGWKYTVNNDAAETIAKAGTRISEDFVFEISPAGGATYKTTITANVASNSSYVEEEGSLDVSDTTITGITILTNRITTDDGRTLSLMVDPDGNVFAVDGIGRHYAVDADGKVATAISLGEDISDKEPLNGDASSVRTDGDIVTASTSWGNLEFNTNTGAWVYTLNNNDPDFQAMKASDTPLTETFVVEITKTGGTKATENIVININGADEDIYFVDADGNEVDTLPGSAEITTTHFFFPDPATISGTILQPLGQTVTENAINANVVYGVLTFNAEANFWEYTLNHEHAAVKALAIGGTLTDTIAFDTTPSSGGATTTETIEIKIALGHQGIYFADENGDVITLARGKQYFAQDGFSDQYVTTSGGPFDITLDLNNPAVTSPGGLILGDVLPEIGGLIDIRSARVAFADGVSVDLKNIFYISGDGTLAINPIGTDAEVEALLAGLGDSVTLDLVITAPRETAEELTYQVVVDVVNGNSNVLASIPENAVGGTEVGRLRSFTEQGFFNPNEAGEATLTYSITAGNAGGVFAIGDDGVITLAPSATLDAETTASYTLSITATYDPDGNSATTNDIETHSFDVVINVGDVNEHDPAFAANAVAWQTDFTSGNIPENTKIGTHLATITATDADITKSLNYAITGGNDDDIFAISPISGRLTLNGALDFEDSSIDNSYSLTITAYDGDATDADTKSSTTTVTITITNVAPEFGDNAVAWASGFANGNVAENTDTTNPVTLGTVAAEPQGNTNPLTYSIIGGNDDGIFSLTGAGALSLVKPLDAETTASHTLTIQVSDGTTTPDTTTIAITVGDVNEHTPAAPTISWAADFAGGNVAENTRPDTPLATVTATDADARPTLSYSISGAGSNLFNIDNNGNLILKGRLDFETTETYTLMITASDGTNISTATAITITVTDSDPDLNSMTWESGFENGAVSENTAAGTAIASFDVTHSKPGIFFRVNDDAFAVDSDGKLRLTRKLDYETTTQHNLRVIVSDGTSSDFMDVVVTVQDAEIEFNAPAWETDFANGVIAEDTTTGTKLATISAKREDDTTNNLGYSIVAGNDGNIFTIDNNGVLTLANALDYDDASTYSLTIRITDTTNTAHTADVAVDIEVVNVNKDAPTDPTITWEADFTGGNVAEDTAIGTTLASVSSTDGDDDETVTYSITAGNTGDVFFIDEDTGDISLAGALDYETDTSYTLTITASDGTKTATTDITITVTDVDPELVWAKGFADGIVAESAAAGRYIATLTKDADNTASLRYAITDGSSGGIFAIDENTGAITLEGALDYATTPDYTLTIQTTNTATNTVIATTEVHIRVGGTEVIWEAGFGSGSTFVDVNNDPIVNTANVGANVSGVTILGSFSHNRFADDATTYSIAGGNTHRFAIHNGDLYFFGDAGTRAYTLTIIATDGTLTDSTDIFVVVGNDNAPAFESAPVAWEAGFADNVLENTAIGTLLGRVDASDADGARLSYYFVENGTAVSSVGAFNINEYTGAITLTSSLNYEAATSHDLTIRVFDGYRTTDTDISIAVGDVDVEVHWLARFADGNVREEQGTAGTLLATINPDDMSANHGYRFIDGSQIFGAFTINDSGELLIREDLNYKDATSHRLDVKIIDTTTSETITVVPPIIVNVVDAYPRLAVTPVRWTMTDLSEATPIGTVFGQVDAADPDSRINYSFVHNGKAVSSVGPFTIGRKDGMIKLTEYLDYDTASSYALTIRVTDGVNHRDTAPQTITITDSGSELIWVDEGTATNTVIGTIAPDNPNPAQTYRFVGGALVDGPFTVNANNGDIIFTGAVLNYETTPAHALQVEVVENNSVTTTINVSIRVVDVNEAPTFSPAPVLLSGGGATSSIDVNENADIGTLLGRAVALDPEGDKLNYAFVENGALTSTVGAFTISLGGKISVSSDLNYESTDSYSLTIRARDSFDYDAKFADATITINVNDADTEIVWGRGFIGGNVGETTATNTQLATITHDTPGTRTYEFGNGAQTDGAFTIDANTGTITLTGALDYETAASHALTIRITDTIAGTPPEVIPITINVLNEIETTWEAGFANGAVSENTAFGTNLAYMTEGRGGVAYRIVGGDEEGLFVLDQDVEEIKDSLGKVIDRILHGTNLALEGVLDYETKSTYILDIQLIKGDGEFSTTQVTINVGDGNDAPKFGDSPITWSIGGTDYTERDESPAYEISAMPAAGATLGTITATDPNNDALTYRIIGDGYGGFDDEENPREKLFTIQNGNEIALTGALPIFPNIYRLTIEASDGSLTDTTDVVIRIGSNDGAPVFGASPVSWQQDFANGISENVGAGTVVALLNGVTDKESGDFVRFYFIDEDGAHTPRLGAFDIVLLGRDENGETVDNIAKYLKANPNSPVSINYAIRLNERVDYETASILSDGTRGYKLKIGASDSFIAGTGNIAEATDIIEVRVHDIDDYVTWETGRGYANGNVEEKNSGVLGDVIGRVRADVDGDNDNLRFYFLENNVRTSKIEYRGEDTNNGNPTIGEIVIDDRTGEIMFRNINPDFENGPTTHNLVVEISLEDSSNQLIPKRTLDVTIDIVDVNERPAFTQSTYDFGTVLQNAPLELSIGSVEANDIDAGDEITYSIFSGNNDDFFEINPMTGEITVKSMLDYDATTASNNSHSLIIRATDKAGLFSTATVTIEVEEYITSKPVLSVTGATPNIAEQETASTDAVSASGITISVTGGDPNRNDFIVTGDAEDRFDVVEVDGVWTLQLKSGEVLDYADANADGTPDTDPTITLTLQVDDGSVPGGTGRVSNTETLTVTVLDRPALALATASPKGGSLDISANGATTPESLGVTFDVTDADTTLASANVEFDVSVVSSDSFSNAGFSDEDFAVNEVGGAYTLQYVGAPRITNYDDLTNLANFLNPIIDLDVTVSTDGVASTDTIRVQVNLHDGTYLDFRQYEGKSAVFKVNQADDVSIEPVDLDDISTLVGSNIIYLNEHYDGRAVGLSKGRDIYVIENNINTDNTINIRDVSVDPQDIQSSIMRFDSNIQFKSVTGLVGFEGVAIGYELTLDTDGDKATTDDEVILNVRSLDPNTGHHFQNGEFGEIQDFESFTGTLIADIPIPEII